MTLMMKFYGSWSLNDQRMTDNKKWRCREKAKKGGEKCKWMSLLDVVGECCRIFKDYNSLGWYTHSFIRKFHLTKGKKIPRGRFNSLWKRPLRTSYTTLYWFCFLFFWLFSVFVCCVMFRFVWHSSVAHHSLDSHHTPLFHSTFFIFIIMTMTVQWSHWHQRQQRQQQDKRKHYSRVDKHKTSSKHFIIIVHRLCITVLASRLLAISLARSLRFVYTL